MYQVTLFDNDGAIVGVEHFSHWTGAMTFMVKLALLHQQAPLMYILVRQSGNCHNVPESRVWYLAESWCDNDYYGLER